MLQEREPLPLARHELIALELARKIAAGSLSPGKRLSGRSTLAGLYNVSPETVRKALALLESYGVVRVTHGSGAIVGSAEAAARFIEVVDRETRFKDAVERLQVLLRERRRLDDEVQVAVDNLISLVGKRLGV